MTKLELKFGGETATGTFDFSLDVGESFKVFKPEVSQASRKSMKVGSVQVMGWGVALKCF